MLTTIETEAAKVATKLAVERLSALLGQCKDAIVKGHDAPLVTQRRLEAHAQRVMHWSSTYTFLGLAIPKDSKRDSIALRFGLTPRRYRSRKSKRESTVLLESELLESGRSMVVLGEPGAGKTTTLRRLALSVLTEEGASADPHQFVVLVVLREVSTRKFLCEELAEILGLQCEKHRIAGDDHGVGDSRGSIRRRDYDIRIAGVRAEDMIVRALDSIAALLLIDGLDEVPQSRRESIETEIEALNSRATQCVTILSCRSGDFSASLQDFRVTEIAPLDQGEIESIAQLWLGDPKKFLLALGQSPYRDIVDRPLLLSFLLFLFEAEGELPEQPSLIYRKVVYRLLRDWDEERRIRRPSRYASFDPDRKIDFLSELAYELTFRVQGKLFEEKVFREIFKRMHGSYRLPLSEYKRVAAEIQTHTGIVAASGIDAFEFAHLSIQEYLCAHYIVRVPVPELLREYLSAYPAPVAVACALSSNASAFFGEMILRHVAERLTDPENSLHGETEALQLTLFGDDSARTLRSFLSRLQVENPFFKVDLRLGEAVLCLFAFYFRRYTEAVDVLLVELAQQESVRGSMKRALELMPNVVACKVAGGLVALNLDGWFGGIYGRMNGHWEPKGALARKFPLTILTKEIWTSTAPRGITVGRMGRAAREKFHFTLAASPFCALEFGRHEFGESRPRTCLVCGKRKDEGRVRRGKGSRR